MKVICNTTNNKKEVVKAANAVDGFKKAVGKQLTLNGIVMIEKEEADTNTGEIKTVTVSALRYGDGEYITSISPTVKDSLEVILATYEEDEIAAGIPIEIKSGTSKSDRTFIYVDLV